MINSVVLVGRLGNDPELTYTQSGTAICKFRVAVNRPPRRDSDQEETDWLNIVTFGRTAETCGQYLDKGALVGIGAIVPGFSGGVLAVVFGIYEPLIRFLGNIRSKFVENFLYFLPVGIGGVIGVVAFSAVVDYAFANYAAQFTWLFIGFIAVGLLYAWRKGVLTWT